MKYTLSDFFPVFCLKNHYKKSFGIIKCILLFDTLLENIVLIYIGCFIVKSYVVAYHADIYKRLLSLIKKLACDNSKSTLVIFYFIGQIYISKTYNNDCLLPLKNYTGIAKRDVLLVNSCTVAIMLRKEKCY
ncbi:hypothetical protein BDC45DRAFT_529794 [Circinella umbellata]|nr:hypothetical protein BDC45DRAFT_529794 [Circinella umbellata]